MKYWMRKLKKVHAAATPSSKSFIPLTTIGSIAMTSPSLLVVRVGSASIELRSGFDPQLLREAVEVLCTSFVMCGVIISEKIFRVVETGFSKLLRKCIFIHHNVWKCFMKIY